MRILALSVLILLSGSASGQQPNGLNNSHLPPPVNFTADQDKKHMMDQLGIKALRPGFSGNESAPNHANYDEALANPYPELPELLVLKNGRNVTTPEMWWKQRRPEIAEDFEREVYGRIPSNVPAVTWTVLFSEREFVARTPVNVRQLVGRVDNSTHPFMDVNISMTLVTPAEAKGPVPVLMMFGPSVPPAPVQPGREDFDELNAAIKELLSRDPAIKAIFDKYPAYNPLVRPQGVGLSGFPLPAGPAAADAPATHQLIAAGWGYALVDPRLHSGR